MDAGSTSQITVPTIIDVPELIVTGDDNDYVDDESFSSQWMSKLQFLASAMSYTVGLGSLWRFPALCYKYSGGAFLFAYSVMFVLIGVPLFMMELAFGQYANEGPITSWRISPAFEGIGYSMCLVSSIVALYYNTLNSYSLYYLFASLKFSALPFASCSNAWNTNRCWRSSIDELNITSVLNLPSECSASNVSILVTSEQHSRLQQATANSTQSKLITTKLASSQAVGANILLFPDAATTAASNSLAGSTVASAAAAASTAAISSSRNISSCVANLTTNPFEFEKIIDASNNATTLAANEYFSINMLSISPSIESANTFNFQQWLCTLLTSAIVFVAVNKNWTLSGKLSIIAMIAPYVVLMAVFIRTLMLDGAFVGLSIYLNPDWTKLQDMAIWADASTQLFFTLSPCLGGIMMLACMNKFHNNFHFDAMLIAGLSYVTSLLCGGVAFVTLGHMADYSSLDIQSVVDQGLGFAFVVYSEAMTNMPLPTLSSSLFFAMLFCLGVLSQLSLIKQVIITIIDTCPQKFRYRRIFILAVGCIVMGFTGTLMCFNNGFHILQLVDYFGATYSALIIGLAETVALAWVYGIVNFMQDVEEMIGVHQIQFFPSRSFWAFMWRYLTPSVIFSVLLFSMTDLPLINYADKDYPHWTIAFGWFMTISCTIFIPGIALVRLIVSTNGSFVDRLNDLCRPSEDWAPSSYVSGSNLFNKHMNLIDNEQSIFTSHSASSNIDTTQNPMNDDDEDDDGEDDVKFVDGKANYIIPEDDVEVGLIASESTM